MFDANKPRCNQSIFANNSTALERIKTEGLRQIMVEAVSGKISEAVAKKLSNGNAIAEKLLEKGIGKAQAIISKKF